MLHIGIAPCFMHPHPKRIVFGPKTLIYIENDMAHFIAQPGVVPCLLPDLDDNHLHPILDSMDGLVLQGGVDISPENYGATRIPGDFNHPSDHHRDLYDMKILDYAIKHRKPLLGICRGCQLINVYFGGTLIQDIPTQRPDWLQHRDADKYDTLQHDITFTPDSILRDIYPDTEGGVVNTVHHQGIDTLGDNLAVHAYCAHDDAIEAIHYTGNTFVMGIQWHPEFGGNILESVPLMEHFLSRCACSG